jgi:hypothetical protein
VRRSGTAFLATAIVAFAAPTARAQSLQRGDVTASVGWFNVHQQGAPDYADWYNRSVYGGVAFGYYWTDHLKTDVELGKTSAATFLTFEPMQRPQGTARGLWPTEHRIDRVKLSVTQSYQFFRNAWWHPIVGGGVDLDFERRRTGTLPVPFPGSDTSEEVESLEPKLVGIVGFKAYLSSRSFFRTDVKVAGARRIDQVLWRFGVGFDF